MIRSGIRESESERERKRREETVKMFEQSPSFEPPSCDKKEKAGLRSLCDFEASPDRGG